MPRAVLALGSNLGNRRQWIIKALAAIKVSKGIDLVGISPLVESKALTLAGFDSSKPKFLNCVAEIETSLNPEKLLAVVQGIEQLLGRKKLERWGDRNIDIDIITYASQSSRSVDLVIPHPEAAKRAFVIVPWYLMDQKARLPGFGSIEKLAYGFADQVKLK
ncbi:MAG: 2-amino-4-hydroxy-6-hydroxymethyldihydropteridine diphosphokinase [Actinomycetes bacterium]